jgi:hypothetical protein
VIHVHRHRGDGTTRIWQSADGVHIDVRGLNPPEPMIEILKLLDGGGLSSLTAHLDREPIFLYPELEERGWSHEVLPSECGDTACDHEVRLHLVRLYP